MNKKLLVHCNYEQAERTIRILGLAPDVWEPWGYRDMLGGQCWEQIVVVNTWPLKMNDHVRQWLKEDLPLKLPPGKYVELL